MVAYDCPPGLVTVVKDVELLGEEVPGYLAVLIARAGLLAFYYYARGDVFQLDCGICFVLFVLGPSILVSRVNQNLHTRVLSSSLNGLNRGEGGTCLLVLKRCKDRGRG